MLNRLPPIDSLIASRSILAGSTYRELHGNVRCPCASGLRYSKCCKVRLQKWVVSDSGDLRKEVSLNAEALAVFDEAGEHFKEAFGREPAGSDLVLPTLLFMTEAESAEQGARAMMMAGVRPHVVYASWKTGFYVGESNYEAMPPSDRKEYDAAIEEYFDREELGENPLVDLQPRPSPVTALYQQVMWVAGSTFLAEFDSEDRLKDNPRLHLVTTCYFGRLLRTLRNISILVENGSYTDSLVLARTLYELHVHTRYLLEAADGRFRVVDVALGLLTGSYVYEKRKDGRPGREYATNVLTNQRVRVDLTNWQMISAVGDASDKVMYNVFYDHLSTHAHPDLALFFQGGFWDTSHHLVEEGCQIALIVALGLAILTIDTLSRSDLVGDHSKRDLEHLFASAGTRWIRLFDLSSKATLASSTRRRIKEVLTKLVTTVGEAEAQLKTP